MAQRITINTGKKDAYPIVYTNSFTELAEELTTLECAEKRIAIVTDSKVEKLYAQEIAAICSSICKEVIMFSFPAGEESKNLSTVQELYRFLIAHKWDRNDMLLALGGGVVGDLAGYTAATYLRGISFIQIPTTLLSQVDSSIGGKTGVDFEQYKNMIGAFHMPKLVYTNLSVLKDLEERQFFSGMAEVMKAGLIKDAAFYEWIISNMYEICEKDMAVLKELVVRSCLIKKAIVEKDPFEKGERALLNLGHTIGHAIEKEKNFTLLHGECVALGCVAAAFISFQKNLLSAEEYYEIRDMFVPFYLPISIDQLDETRMLEFMTHDKKMQSGKINFILLKKIGKAVIDKSVTQAELKNAIEELCVREEEER